MLYRKALKIIPFLGKFKFKNIFPQFVSKALSIVDKREEEGGTVINLTENNLTDLIIKFLTGQVMVDSHILGLYLL